MACHPTSSCRCFVRGRIERRERASSEHHEPPPGWQMAYLEVLTGRSNLIVQSEASLDLLVLLWTPDALERVSDTGCQAVPLQITTDLMTTRIERSYPVIVLPYSRLGSV
jgi:hypothetical protein